MVNEALNTSLQSLARDSGSGVPRLRASRFAGRLERFTDARLEDALAAIPALVDTVQTLQAQVSMLSARLEQNEEASRELPQGFIDPKTAAAKKFYSVEEVAFLLNVSKKTVYKFLKEGKLRTSKGLRVKRIPVEEIERYKRATV